MTKQQYCPNCGSHRWQPIPQEKSKPNDTLSFECRDCGYYFAVPSYNKITWTYWKGDKQ